MRRSIKPFISNHVSLANRVILMLCIIIFLFSLIFIEINHYFFHFTHITLFATDFSIGNLGLDILLTALCLCMFIYGMYAKDTSPRGSTFIWGFGGIILTFYANIALSNAIQTTPFTPIDDHLAKFDAWLGVNTPALMAWTHHHIHLLKLFKGAYAAILIELSLIPIALACINARRALSIFLIAQLSTFLIGSLIYYFFPTMAPSGIFHSPYFSEAQHDTSLRFYDVHHFIPVPTTKGGLIAFPSFHVIWAILLTYCTIEKKWIFYPLACFNIILISATVFLGWHYLTDVIAGFILAFFGIYFGKKCQKK